MRFKQFNEEADKLDKLESMIASIMHNNPSLTYTKAKVQAQIEYEKKAKAYRDKYGSAATGK